METEMKNSLVIAALTLLSTLSTNAFAGDAAQAGSSAPTTSAAKIVTVGGKQIVADRNGMTVYSFDPDTAGVSTCYNGCAKEWPPVLVSATDAIVAPYGTTVRKEGTIQLTISGHPVYLFIDDKAPGDITGDGDDGIWHIVPAPAL
jgi:predicted lipoprotein with Yx(FWY)xxD motif